MHPNSLQLIGDQLVVVWNDGHESYYRVESLRRNCPCAVCAGEPDLFGRLAKGAEPKYSASSFEIASLEQIGNYGIQPTWADGHTWGIWTFDRLRHSCECDLCRVQES